MAVSAFQPAGFLGRTYCQRVLRYTGLCRNIFTGLQTICRMRLAELSAASAARPGLLDNCYRLKRTVRIMDPIAAILLSVQTQLGARVPELAYIDKDWGQLSYEVPSVKWPCALLDVEKRQLYARGRRPTDGRHAAHDYGRRYASHSGLPGGAKATGCLPHHRTAGKIHQALQHFSAGNYAPLFRTNLKKVMVNSSYECYRLIYQTAFEDGFDTGATTSRIQGVRLNLK